MKIKWRLFETVLITLLVFLQVSEYTRNCIKLHLYWRSLGPPLGYIFLLYMCYWLVNIFPIAIFRQIGNNMVKRYSLAGFQLFGIGLLLSLGISVATHYSNPSYFNDFEFTPFTLFGIDNLSPHHLFSGFEKAIITIFLYCSYAIIRETIIYQIENSSSGKKNKIYTINKLGGLLLLYFCIPAIIHTFQVDFFVKYYVIYLTFITPSLLTYITITYWVLPLKLLIFSKVHLVAFFAFISFIYTIIAFGLLSQVGFVRDWWILSWCIQLLLVSPASWLLFKIRKVKIFPSSPEIAKY